MEILNKRQQQPEQMPSQKKRMYVDIATKDLCWFEPMIKKAGIIYDIRKQTDSVTRCIFDEECTPDVKAILQTPPECRPKKLSGVDALIGMAQERSQISNNPRNEATIVVDDNAVQSKMSDKTQMKKPIAHPRVPSENENRWAEQKLAEELLEIEKEIQEANRLLDEMSVMDTERGMVESVLKGCEKRKKRRQSIGRTHQIKTRLTDTELVQFQRRLKKAGLSQGDFLRSAALTGQIIIEDHSVGDVAMLDELAMIRAELGRQGGLLKMIIKPNEGQRELAPEEWSELIVTVRELEKMKKRLANLEVRIQNGNSEAQRSGVFYKTLICVWDLCAIFIK